MTTLTGSVATKLLKAVISDYNYWGESESDSPLAIKRTKGVLDEKKILSLDASARRKATQTEGYKAPERRIATKTLDEVFGPLVVRSLEELTNTAPSVMDGTAAIAQLLLPAEAVEYYVQLYSAFKQLSEPKVCYVEDAEGDPYTGLFIMGTSADGETVYAQGLLTQT
ncbi:hypothetical protein ACE1CI_03415 [Aerosakkonemataceae cyanobacterium BLCC-F50]|uniref:Uncharacterized protein n=1 Tax=Floridaenema flaviceps BLCC-F50 TaxID=3153642 RepID=A0ABV4XJU3_9CYAN